MIRAIIVLLLSSCATKVVTPPDQNVEPVSGERIVLSWENTTDPHPERKPWSDHLTKLVDADMSIYDSAKDIEFFCPKFKSLDDQRKIKAVSEMWVATAYYESGYNPNSQSVDVGTKSDRNTWSIGLLQMSQVDQSSYKLPFGFSFDDLLQPENNLTLGLAVMKKQIQRRGLIVVPTSPYWAVLYRGKYSKVDEISARVVAKTGFCK